MNLLQRAAAALRQGRRRRYESLVTRLVVELRRTRAEVERLIVLPRPTRRVLIINTDPYFIHLEPYEHGWLVILEKPNGDRYTVAGDRCSCKGNTYHGHCKHVDAIHEVMDP